eukprot:TRINITY_DN4115_c0_g1_i2.p1 TRINITY_DN4115_c0_g1~~TRINITY_DN4115_c0_g1_i2.p1  ORF type:complete len:238 (-),score=23.82 TRINITY_DN4115_c0_g1_i2:10-723(-)
MPFSTSHPIGTVKQIGDYIRTGYFTTNGYIPRKWNLSNEGEYSKNGRLTYNLGANWHDPNGVAREEQREEWRNAFQQFSSYGINFVETSDYNADIGVGDNKYNSWEVLENVQSTDSGTLIRAGIDALYYSFSDDFPERYVRGVGVALGLGRPGNYRIAADSVSSYPNEQLAFANDTYQMSALSAVPSSFIWDASDYYSNPSYFDFNIALTPMPADLQALADMYSAHGFGSPKAWPLV